MPAGVVIKERGLNVSRKNCFILACRDQRPGEGHGKWVPVTSHGFLVVFLSKYEAAEGMWFLGPKLGLGPPDPNWSDERYLDWLEEHHFRVYPYEARGDIDVPGDKGELRAIFMYEGWEPKAEDILAVPDSIVILQQALKAKLSHLM